MQQIHAHKFTQQIHAQTHASFSRQIHASGAGSGGAARRRAQGGGGAVARGSAQAGQGGCRGRVGWERGGAACKGAWGGAVEGLPQYAANEHV